MSKIWTNGVQLCDRVENVAEKEEIARHEQFLLYPQCFQKLPVFNKVKNILGKGDNNDYQHFFPLPTFPVDFLYRVINAW